MNSAPFDSQLNAEQLAAATAPDGPILVLAAAGTGKTRTLTFRVAHLIQKGVAPGNILLLTFTNKAAHEMLDRAQSLVGGAVGGMLGGTFHHLANRMLRRYGSLIGFQPDFTILDRDDARTLVSQSIKDLKVSSPEMPTAGVLLGIFSAAANTERNIEDVLNDKLPLDVETTARIGEVHEEYSRRKKDMGAMDFDDLLVHALQLLREHATVQDRYSEQFQHILVDEYQDTNSLQAELVDRLASMHRNLLVVGDDFQSIYAWRGGDYRNIMSFRERYPDARTYLLETNYRSVPEVLAVANACIAGNPDQYQKSLRPTRERYACPVHSRMRDGEEQARFVVERIHQFRKEGYRMADIAILYRAHFHAIELERALTRMRLPYVITSGVRFFEQAHVKDVCSLLRIVGAPGDEMAFLRLLCLLPGVGERTARKAWRALDNRFVARDEEQRRILREALPAKARPEWEPVDRILDELPDTLSGYDAGDIVQNFIGAFYESHAYRTYENAEHRIDDVTALCDDCSKFEKLEDFLSDMALLTNLDGETEHEDAETEGVRLSTVHQAKGLEWPVVFVIWASEGMFPSPRSLNESEGGEAEERRLFYVAVTRAQDELIVATPELRRTRDGGVIYCPPSRFVDEIPRNLFRNHQVAMI